MNRKLLKSAMLLLMCKASAAQQPFVITGQLGGYTKGHVKLEYVKKGETLSEVVPVKEGVFTIKGDLEAPGLAGLCCTDEYGHNDERYSRVLFYLDSGKTTVQSAGDFSVLRIDGGKSQQEFVLLNKQKAPAVSRLDTLYKQMAKARKEMNDTLMRSIQQRAALSGAQVKLIDSAFIATHPDSYVAFDLWSNSHRGIMDPQLEPDFKRFSTSIQQSWMGSIVAGKLETARRLDVGKPAPGFTLKDDSGKEVTLASFKGKNVLLCFWYRHFWGFNEFSFNLGKVQRLLPDKNLVILAVSYDKDSLWKNTIEEEGMDYVNVTDEGGILPGGAATENRAVSVVAKAYGLTSMTYLPQGYLIGADGNIIARHLNFKDAGLAAKIEKLLVP